MVIRGRFETLTVAIATIGSLHLARDFDVKDTHHNTSFSTKIFTCNFLRSNLLSHIFQQSTWNHFKNLAQIFGV